MYQLETFRAYLDERVLATDYSSDTAATYRSRVRHFLAWLAAHPGMTFTRTSFGAYLAERQRAGLTPKTLRSDRDALACYAGWLRTLGQEAPEVSNLRLPPEVDTRRPLIAPEHFAAMWDGARNMGDFTAEERWHRARTLAVLALLFYTGVRRRELLRLRAADVTRSDEGWSVVVIWGKGRRQDTLPLPAVAAPHLEAYLEIREQWLAGRSAAARAREALFPSTRSAPMDDNGLTSLWRRVLHQAGLPVRKYTPHDCRRWFATWLLSITGNPEDAMEYTRHARADTFWKYVKGSGGGRKRSVLDALPQPGQVAAPPSAPDTEGQFRSRRRIVPGERPDRRRGPRGRSGTARAA